MTNAHSNDDLTALVDKGEEFLNANVEDWKQRLRSSYRIHTFDMAEECGCLLGILFGFYTLGTEELNITREEAISMGLYCEQGDVPDVYERLTKLWLERIYK